MKYTCFLKLNENITKNMSSRQNLWHAINLENAVKCLDENMLKPYTSHRYWPDGKRRQDNDPLYEDSYWMYGWSMTRKKEYAFSWSGVVFEFDAEEIAHKFKIIPLAWNNLFSAKKGFEKKEFEEFVLSKKVPKSRRDLEEEDLQRDILIDDLYDLERTAEVQKKIDDLYNVPSWLQRWSSPHGDNLSLAKCLKGIYLDEFLIEVYSKEKSGRELIAKIQNHPLYKGTFSKLEKEQSNKPKLI